MKISCCLLLLASFLSYSYPQEDEDFLRSSAQEEEVVDTSYLRGSDAKKIEDDEEDLSLRKDAKKIEDDDEDLSLREEAEYMEIDLGENMIYMATDREQGLLMDDGDLAGDMIDMVRQNLIITIVVFLLDLVWCSLKEIHSIAFLKFAVGG